MSTESVMTSNHFILCHPHLLWPLIFPSIRVFSNESVLHIRWSKYWNFSYSINPPSEYSGLISFRMDWFESPRNSQQSSPTPQFKSINSQALSFLICPNLTSIHDYWKKHSFDQMTFVSKTMFLLFNMLSRLVIAFLPRSKHLLISWLQSSAMKQKQMFFSGIFLLFSMIQWMLVILSLVPLPFLNPT